MDPSLERTVTEPLEDGETVAAWPSAKDVVKGTSDLVIVVTSPLDCVARYKALRSIEELESVACELLDDVELTVTTETSTALPLVEVEAKHSQHIG